MRKVSLRELLNPDFSYTVAQQKLLRGYRKLNPLPEKTINHALATILWLNRGARALAYNKTRLQGKGAPYDLNLYRDPKNFRRTKYRDVLRGATMGTTVV